VVTAAKGLLRPAAIWGTRLVAEVGGIKSGTARTGGAGGTATVADGDRAGGAAATGELVTAGLAATTAAVGDSGDSTVLRLSQPVSSTSPIEPIHHIVFINPDSPKCFSQNNDDRPT